MTEMCNMGYNDRLFETNRIRRFYHLARFFWVRDVCVKYSIDLNRVMELGCFDGRLLSYFPRKPNSYVGVDANVEGGLDLAKERFAADNSVALIESRSPDDVNRFPDKYFSAIASLETIEHVDPQLLPVYLDNFTRLLSGHLLITVPNEKGPVFLAKQVAKMVIGSRSEPYSFSELMYAALGRMEKVERKEHKGFDYSALISDVSRRFDVVDVVGLPFRFLPPYFNLTVAIIAKSRGK